MWTTITSFLGEWWPLSIVRQQVDELTSGLDPIVSTFYRDATKAVDLLAAQGKLTAAGLETAKAELAKQQQAIDGRLAELRRLAPDSQRAQLMAATVAQGVAVFDAKFSAFSDEAQRTVNVANQATQGVGDFLATFKENPGKRLISIWAGVLAGLAVSTALGLDLFQAVFAPEATTGVTAAAAGRIATPDPAGIVVTGIVIGLGASPTHEIIRVLQEIKKARKTENQPAIQ
jgi:hypothetical protein